MIPAFRRLVPTTACLAMVLAAVSCQRVPLLAPTGSTITLTTSTTALALGGQTILIAQVVEASGTPPHSGTHVTFTTTLGAVQPSDVETDINGQAKAIFSAGNASGTATITATSGGVTTGTNGSVKIAIGAAAVGRIVVSGNPTTVPAQGGQSTITASVADTNGNVLGGIPVTFTTTAGTLSSSVATTDANGNAQSLLTTSVQAVVTATAGVNGSGTGTGGGTGTGTGTGTGSGTGSGSGSTSSQAQGTVTINVATAPTITISPATTGTLTAGSPITFNLAVTPAAGATTTIRDVAVDFGDGTVVDLGAVQGSGLSIQHVYSNTATQSFTVRATVTDSLGFPSSAATIVVVQPQPPLSVSITTSQVASGGTTAVTFTATVTPSSQTVASYVWSFGDGNSQTTTNNQVVHSYVTGSGQKIVTVTVTTTTGQTQTGQTVVNP